MKSDKYSLITSERNKFHFSIKFDYSSDIVNSFGVIYN